MKTAKNLLRQKVYITKDGVEDVHDTLVTVSDVMIEFAQMHVTEALKAACKKAEYNMVDTTDHSEPLPMLIEDSILKSYSLDNIK